ncbi:MAG: polysaccharide deacetylase family protein [Eubacteriales bacterium]|nr:polysaccharide deacetylase family protein [Eubacteriales bacterium]
MDNEFEPKPDEQQDKHEQAKASLEDLQRMMAEYQEKHPETEEKIEKSDSTEQAAPQETEEEQSEAAQEPQAEPVQEEQPEQPEKSKKSEEPEKTEEPEESVEKEPAQKKAAAPAKKKPAENKDTDAQADEEQKQREAILDKQAKRNHPDQPLATMKLNGSAKKKAASDGKKPAAKKSAKSRKAAAARRRKKRLMRLGATVVILLVLIVVVVSVVRALGGKGNSDPAGSGDIGSGIVANGTSQTEEKIDTSKPASQQESEQYKKIKDDTSLPAYALEYPGMYADAVSEPNEESEKKVCYLTFDDGPSSTNTPGILDALKQADVKATFFVVTSEIDGNEDILKRIVDEGHTLCIHANEHVYGDLYSSVESYLKDFSTAYDKIYALTGYRVQGFRFPGGSNNAVMQRHSTYDAIVGEMTRRGFEYYDWNAYDHDAENGDYSVEQMVNYAIDEVTSSSRNDTVLLMHDTYGKEKTVQALPSIISKLKEAGIEMLPITNSSRPVHFEVNENTPPELPEPETSDADDTSDTDTDSGTNTDDTAA